MTTLEEYQEFIKDLETPETASYVSLQYSELLEHGDMQECLQFINFLGKKMTENSALANKNPQLYDQYQTVWHILAYKCFPILSGLDKQTLLQKRLLYAVQRGFNTDMLIAKYFDMYTDELLTQIFGGFLQDLEKNTETLGISPIESDGNKFLPQVKNWLNDYSEFPTNNAKRGSVDRLNYSNQSANVRTLSQAQRQVLLKILKFHDDLKNVEPVIAPEKYNVADSPVELEEYAEKLTQGLPQPVVRQQVVSPIQTKPSVPIAPAQVFGQPQQRAPERAPGIDIQKKLDELKNRVN